MSGIEKTRTSISLPKTVKARLDNIEQANSALVEDLLERYFYLRDEADKGEVNNIKIRLDQLKDEINDRRERESELKSELERVREEISSLETERDQLVEDLKNKEIEKDRVVKEVSRASYGDRV